MTNLHPENLQTLSHIAHLANRLAKQLSGQERTLAYQIKATALSALIVAGAATPNGSRPDATIGLDIIGHSRLHVPISQLQPEARAIIRRTVNSLLPVSSLADHLNPQQLTLLNSFTEGRAA